MIRPKLGFRNRSALEQLNICQRVIANLSRAPQEQLRDGPLAKTLAAVSAAQASHARLLSLKVALRAETKQRNALLRVARQQVTRAHKMQAGNLASQPQTRRAAGIGFPVVKRPVGQPAKVANLRAQPDLHATTVKLRWERSVRHCSFEIAIREDSQPESEWQIKHTCLQQSSAIKGLESGGLYWFRVRANNAHGAGAWSNPVSARVK